MRYFLVACLLAIGLLAGCGDEEATTVTQTQPAQQPPEGGGAMQQAPPAQDTMEPPAGGGGGEGQYSANNPAVAEEIAQKIKENIEQQVPGAENVEVECTPTSDTMLTCEVTGEVNGVPQSATWEATIDPETGQFEAQPA